MLRNGERKRQQGDKEYNESNVTNYDRNLENLAWDYGDNLLKEGLLASLIT